MNPINALMNIQVRVMARQAQAQLAALQRQTGGLNKASAAAAASSARIGTAGMPSMRKWGSQLQWAGRQLQYNFTVPIALAAGVATKFALDNEAAMTRIQKVYGDASTSTAQMRSETEALGKAFRVLSDRYGVAQKDVLNIGADWAAAGVQGANLAKVTKITLDTMILGEMNAADATRALIQIQAQYGMQAGDLSKTIAVLNMVENQTGTSMEDLIVTMSKSAGTARTAGLSVRELAAMTAALVPAAGTAATAGNALKTIFSRILAPTKDAAGLMKMVGINTESAGWASMNAVQRLMALGKAFQNSTHEQKAQLTTVVAGRYQLNRFDLLLRALTNSHSYYFKAMKATSSQTRNYMQEQRELNQVLSSNPQKFKQLIVMLQNMASDVITPLIPLILSFANGIKSLVERFTNLDPRVQKLIGTMLLLLAVFGPVIRYLGAFATLLSLLKINKVIGFLLRLVYTFGFLAKPIIAAGKAVVWFGLTIIRALAPVVTWVADVFLAVFGTSLARLSVMFRSAAVAAYSVMVGTFRLMARQVQISMIATLRAVMVPLANMARGIVMFGSGIVLRALVDPFRVAAVSVTAYMKGVALAVLDGLAAMGGFVLRAMAPIGLALVAPFGAAFSALTRMSGIWLATMGNLFSRGLTALQLFFFRFGQGLMLVMNGVTGPIMRLWSGMLLFMNRAVVLFNGVIGRLWAFIMSGLTAITATASAAISRAWVAFLALMPRLTATIGLSLQAAWYAVSAAMQFTWALMSAGIRAIWIATLGFISSGRLFTGVLAAFNGLGRGVLAIVMGMSKGVLRIFVSPWGLAVLAVLAVISAFRDKIAQVWNNIVHGASNVPGRIANAFAPITGFFRKMVQFVIRAFNALPEGVQNAIMAVVRTVAKGAQEVYKLFSYLNPFAHHSPSLVENVKGGMNVVRDEHTKTSSHTQQKTKEVASAHKQVTSSMSSAHRSTASTANKTVTRSDSQIQSQAAGISAVDKAIKSAIGDITRFKHAAKGMIPGEWADQIKDVRKQFPGLLPMFMGLIKDYNNLTRTSERQQKAVDNQQKTVDQWKSSLDTANAALDKQQNSLDALQKTLDATQAKYDAAKQSMDDYANAPIKGMQAFTDKIFENSLAQKKLQLQMDQWEQQNGSMDDLNSKFASLNGLIEELQGQAKDLRQKGAGSDILGPINDQIAALQKQAKGVQTAMANSPVAKLQSQMDKLQQAGDILQLQNDIKFDPLTHQIEKLANTSKELDYNTIVTGIKNAKTTMAGLTPTITKQTKAVADQQKAVDSATKARDRVQKTYDAESKRLDNLQAKYQRTADAISKVKDALDSVSSAASAAGSKTGKAAKMGSAASSFKAAGKGDYPEVGGKSTLGSGGGVDEINKFTAQQQKDLAKQLGGFDMFGPLRDMWKKGWAWVVKYIGPVFSELGKLVTGGFKIIGDAISGFVNGGEANKLGSIFTGALKSIRPILTGLINVVKLFWPELKQLFFTLGDVAKELWDRLAPALAHLWKSIQPLVAIIGGALLGVVKIIASVFTNTLGPALKLVIDVVSDVINIVSDVIDVFTGVFNFVKDLFTGQWGKLWVDVSSTFASAWHLIRDTFQGVWDVISGVCKTVWGVIKGFVNGIVGFFKWLYDVLVGHSIVPDLMRSIVKWFRWILKPIGLILKGLMGIVKIAFKPFMGIFKLVTAPIRGVIGTFRLLYKTVSGTIRLLAKVVGTSVKLISRSLGLLKSGAGAAKGALGSLRGGTFGGGFASGVSKAASAMRDLSKAGLAWLGTQARLAAAWVAGKAKMVANTAAVVASKVATLAIAAAEKIWAAVQWLVNAAVEANPITLIITAIVALGVAIYEIIKHWKAVWNFMKMLWNWIKGVFIAGWRGLKVALVAVMNAVWNGIKAAWNGIKAVFQFVWDWIKKGFLLYWNTLKTVISAPIKLAWTLIKGAWDLIKNAFSAAWNWVKKTFQSSWNTIKSVISSPVRAAWNSLKSIWGWIKGVFSGAWSWIKSTWKTSWNVLKSIVTGPVTAARNVISSVWNGIKDAFRSALNWVKSTFKSLWNGVKSILTSPFSAAKDAIKKVFSGLWGAIKSAAHGFTHALDVAWGVIKSIVGAPIRFLISGVLDKGILGAWNWVAGVIPGMGGLKVSPWHTSFDGYRFAKGGILPGYEPGKDKIPAMLSPGEAVLVPEAVKALGAGTIHMLNHMGVLGRSGGRSDKAGGMGMMHFAGGGILGNLNPVTWLHKFIDKVKSIGGNIADHIGGMGDFGKKLINVPTHVVGDAANAVFKWLKALPGKLLRAAWNGIKSFFGLNYNIPTLDEILHGILYAKTAGAKAFAYQNALDDFDNTRDQLIGLSPSHPFHWIDKLNKNKDMGTGYMGSDYKWHKAGSGSQLGVEHPALLGTRNSVNGMYLVGESGPELLKLPYGARVFNKSTTSNQIADTAARVARRMATPVEGSRAATAGGPVTNNTTNNRVTKMTVKVSLPNVKNGDDAEELVRHLEMLGNRNQGQ